MHHGHVDVVSSERFYGLMMAAVYAQGPELDVDLLAGEFPWGQFLMGRPWGLTLLEEQVASMRLMRDRFERPVIRVFTLADPSLRLIRFKGAKAELHAS